MMLRLGFFFLCLLQFSLCMKFEMTDRINDDASPKEQVEWLVSKWKFENEFVFERWWATEDMTCDEVESLLGVMRDNIRADLGLLAKDAQRAVKSVGPPRDLSKKRCFQDVEDQIQEAVNKGVRTFHRCTATSPTILKQIIEDMKDKRDHYKQNINDTESNLERCLEFSNKKSTRHRRQCIKKVENDSKRMTATACHNFRQSNCMKHFTDDILNCSFKVFKLFNENLVDISDTIDECVGYTSYDHSYDENYDYDTTQPTNMLQKTTKGFNTSLKLLSKHVLSDHEAFYSGLNKNYDSEITHFFLGILKLDLIVRHMLDSDIVSYKMLPYYTGLNKTSHDNWSPEEMNCSAEAIKSLRKLTATAHKDMETCKQNFTDGLEKGRKTLRTLLKPINEKLKQAGNVALLRCISRRPQEVFDAASLGTCARLARRGIQLEVKKLWLQLADLQGGVELKEVIGDHLEVKEFLDGSLEATEIIGDKTCLGLRLEELVLHADEVMDNCSRCLYGEFGGSHYAVTPATSSVDFTFGSVWDDTPDDVTLSPMEPNEEEDSYPTTEKHWYYYPTTTESYYYDWPTTTPRVF